MINAKQLKAWRKSSGYTQSNLAKILGVDLMTVSRWEREVTTIPPFLHLTLECMEKKGDEKKAKGINTKRKVKGNVNTKKFPII